MLKVTGVYPQANNERLETEDLVLSLSWNWNNFESGENLWWMVRSGQMTLLEIGLKGPIQFVHHLCLVAIQPDWVTIQDNPCLILAVPEEQGLPVFEWKETGQGAYAIDLSELRLCISREDVVMRFMPQAQIVRFITTDRVRFGIDAEDHLTVLQVTQLTLDEIEAIKSLFVK